MPYKVVDQPTLQRSSLGLGGPRGTHESVEFMLNHYEQEGWRLVGIGESRYLKCLVYHLHREEQSDDTSLNSRVSELS